MVGLLCNVTAAWTPVSCWLHVSAQPVGRPHAGREGCSIGEVEGTEAMMNSNLESVSLLWGAGGV